MAEKHVRDMLDFVVRFRESPGMGEDRAKKMEEKLLQQLKALPAAMRFQEATRAMEEVAAAKVPELFKQQIVQCLEEKLLDAAGAAEEATGKELKGNQKMQQHRFFYNFLLQDDWEAIMNPRASGRTKQRVLANRMQLLGLVYPREAVFKQATAILLLGSHDGAPEHLNVNFVSALNMLQDLKDLCRSAFDKSAFSGLKDYPENARQLPKELFRAAYADRAPAPCPLDLPALHQLSKALAARNTHNSVQQQGGFGQQLGRKDRCLQENMQGALLGQLGSLLMNALQGNGAEGLQNLTLNTRKRNIIQDKDASNPVELQLPAKGLALKDKEEVAEEDEEEQAEEVEEKAAASSNVPEVPDRKKARTSVDEMVSQIQGQLAANKGASPHSSTPAKATPGGDSEKTPSPKPKPSKSTPAKTKPDGGKGAGQCKQAAAGAKAGGKGKGKTVLTAVPKYPGTTKKPPVWTQKCKIYTDTTTNAWRVQKWGEKKDKSFKFSDDPKASWQCLRDYVSEL